MIFFQWNEHYLLSLEGFRLQLIMKSIIQMIYNLNVDVVEIENKRIAGPNIFVFFLWVNTLSQHYHHHHHYHHSSHNIHQIVFNLFIFYRETIINTQTTTTTTQTPNFHPSNFILTKKKKKKNFCSNNFVIFYFF